MYVYIYIYSFTYLFVEVAQKNGHVDKYINTSHSAPSVNNGNMSVYLCVN